MVYFWRDSYLAVMDVDDIHYFLFQSSTFVFFFLLLTTIYVIFKDPRNNFQQIGNNCQC